MICTSCKSEANTIVSDVNYDEFGVSGIRLKNITIYDCPSCNNSIVSIPAMSPLHKLIGETLKKVSPPVAFVYNEMKWRVVLVERSPTSGQELSPSL